MDARKLLIADGSEEFRTALANLMRSTYHVRICSEGSETLSMLHSFRPDILVLDLMLPGLDGISLLYSATADNICPMVLATTHFFTEYITESIDKLGISYVLTKPCDIRATADRINDLRQRIHTPMVTLPEPRAQTSNILTALSMPSKLDGFKYLREAVPILARNPNQAITKELYPAVAAIFNRNSKQIERSIRSAIEKAWLKRDDRIWKMYFPPDPDGNIPKPSNATFITCLANSISFCRELQD